MLSLPAAKKSLLVNCSQGDLVGLEFKLEMSTAEMRAEENKVGAFDVRHNFPKEMFNCSSDLTTTPWCGGEFSIL